MTRKRYSLNDNTTVVAFFRPKVTNNEEERVYRIELRGPYDEILKEWNFLVACTKKEVLQELDLPIDIYYSSWGDIFKYLYIFKYL
jgi:hypothetical protein